MLSLEPVRCPYCGEIFETTVDTSGGNQHYIEDCQVCCRPIVFHLAVDNAGRLDRLDAVREDD